jgi:hypothetical protein
MIPYSPAATRLELIMNGNVLDYFQARKSEPKIRALRAPIMTRSAMMAKAPIIFTWEGEDSDGDKITCNVLVSSDTGKSWQTMAVGLTSPRLEIESKIQTKHRKEYCFLKAKQEAIQLTNKEENTPSIPTHE